MIVPKVNAVDALIMQLDPVHGQIGNTGRNQGRQLRMCYCAYLLTQLHHISAWKCIVYFLL